MEGPENPRPSHALTLTAPPGRLAVPCPLAGPGPARLVYSDGPTTELGLASPVNRLACGWMRLAQPSWGSRTHGHSQPGGLAPWPDCESGRYQGRARGYEAVGPRMQTSFCHSLNKHSFGDSRALGPVLSPEHTEMNKVHTLLGSTGPGSPQRDSHGLDSHESPDRVLPPGLGKGTGTASRRHAADGLPTGMQWAACGQAAARPCGLGQ